MFFDKKCTIWKRSFQIVNGREKEIKNQIYTDISCDFYAPMSQKSAYRPTDDSRETSKELLEVVLPWAYDKVKKWMLIELFDLGSYGIFLIDTVQIHRLPSGKIDNLTLSVHLIENV